MLTEMQMAGAWARSDRERGVHADCPAWRWELASVSNQTEAEMMELVLYMQRKDDPSGALRQDTSSLTGKRNEPEFGADLVGTAPCRKTVHRIASFLARWFWTRSLAR